MRLPRELRNWRARYQGVRPPAGAVSRYVSAACAEAAPSTSVHNLHGIVKGRRRQEEETDRHVPFAVSNPRRP